MKTLPQTPPDDGYRESMSRLLILYTQADRLIMEICAERFASAPDQAAQRPRAKQVGGK